MGSTVITLLSLSVDVMSDDNRDPSPAGRRNHYLCLFCSITSQFSLYVL